MNSAILGCESSTMNSTAVVGVSDYEKGLKVVKK